VNRVLADRLAKLDTIELEYGTHTSFDDGMCAMEAVAWLAGEECSGLPQCACPIIARAMRRLNDLILNRVIRTELLRPLLVRIVDSRAGDNVVVRRTFIAADAAVRIFAPLALEKRGFAELATALRRIPAIVDRETALAAKQAVADAADAYAAADVADAAYATADAADAAAYAAANAAASLAAKLSIYMLGVEMIERMLP